MSYALVDLRDLLKDAIFDLPYASKDNVFNRKFYSHPLCYLHKEPADKLCDVADVLEQQGLKLKLLDGYRPLSIQQCMFDLVGGPYISNPKENGGRHTRGTAVDLTLVDQEGKELEMPSPFDTFNEQSHVDYLHMTKVARGNLALLTAVMHDHGFEVYPFEWWHFDWKGWLDDDKYPALDLSFDELLANG